MRHILAGLMMNVLACGLAGICWAQDSSADAETAPASKSDVTGIPLYWGPEYSSINSQQQDISNMPPEFHAFQHRPVDEVGFSPLTVDDFRFPVPKRSAKGFSYERDYYPDHSVVVWHDRDNMFSVTAFFFTRDMIRDHVQRLVDEYYICEPDLLQQVIDYYAEVTPQNGEIITWVWFSIDDNKEVFSGREENRYFASYLSNFKDKFHLDFGLPKVQKTVDKNVRKFLYQYEKRGKYCCCPTLKQAKCKCSICVSGGNCGKGGVGQCSGCGGSLPCAKKCGGGSSCSKCKGATRCPNCSGAAPCASCGKYNCGCSCPAKCSKPCDRGLDCRDFTYHGFNFDLNSHYLYTPRKVVIEDVTYDHVAGAYRWKFAWRFNDCEVDWLRQMCQYGEKFEMGLVLSDPTWYSYVPLEKQLKRDILAAVDPDTWGNVWKAGEIPYDMSGCVCKLPDCDGNCQALPPVGCGYVEPAPPVETAFTPLPSPAPPVPSGSFDYFPPQEESDEVITVPGKG